MIISQHRIEEYLKSKPLWKTIAIDNSWFTSLLLILQLLFMAVLYLWDLKKITLHISNTDQFVQEFQLTKFFLFLNSRCNTDQFASPQAIFLEWIRIELKCTCHIIQSFRIHRTISIEFIENIIEILELAKQQFTISSLRSIWVEKLDTTGLVAEFHPDRQWSYSSWPIRDLGPEQQFHRWYPLHDLAQQSSDFEFSVQQPNLGRHPFIQL